MSGRECLVVVVVLSLGVLCACSKSNSEKVCDPGATQHCACLGSADGVQTCADDGTKWESCVCPNGDGGVQQDAPVAGDAAGDAGPDDAGGGDTGPQVVTVPQIAQGQITDGTIVKVTGVVATSQLFLNRRSSSTGSCEWGLFVSAPSIATAEAYSGLFVSGYGTNAAIPDGGTSAYCPELGQAATGSPIPEGTQPGDVLTLTGKVYAYTPSGCPTDPPPSQVPQWRLSEISDAQKTGTATVPAPATIAAADIAKLASPTETTFHAQWSGARVKLANVTVAYPTTPVACPDTGYNYVDSYGGITLTPSGLTVGDHVYYRGLGHFADACLARPVLCGGNTSGLNLTLVQGAHHLDMCVWNLLPNDKCSDLSPHSSDCPGSTCAPY
jgi:hypothetical protein